MPKVQVKNGSLHDPHTDEFCLLIVLSKFADMCESLDLPVPVKEFLSSSFGVFSEDDVESPCLVVYQPEC